MDSKIQVSYDWNLSCSSTIPNPFCSNVQQDYSSTILHILTQVKGRKICSDGQQVKFVNRSTIVSQDKT